MWRNIPATLSHTQHHQLAVQNHYEMVPLSKTLTEERSWLLQVIQSGTFECYSLPRSPLHPVYNWKLAGVKEQRVWRCAYYFSLQDSFVYDCCWPHAVKLQGNERSYFHGYSVKGYDRSLANLCGHVQMLSTFNLSWPWAWNVIYELLVHVFLTTLWHYKVDSPWPVSFARNSVLHFLSQYPQAMMCTYRPQASFKLTHQTQWLRFIYIWHEQFSCLYLNRDSLEWLGDRTWISGIAHHTYASPSNSLSSLLQSTDKQMEIDLQVKFKSMEIQTALHKNIRHMSLVVSRRGSTCSVTDPER